MIFGLDLPQKMAEYARTAISRTPEARIEDVYKFLFQAAQGGEHAVLSTQEAEMWLRGEWNSLGRPRPGEPIAVSLRPDGRLIRVNLRPYKAAGGTEHQMLQAFVRSARAFRGDRSKFELAWHAFGISLRGRPLAHVYAADWSRLDK